MAQLTQPMVLFLKLGGSLITDKTRIERIRPAVLARLAAEIAAVRAASPSLKLVLGHGSGSFGHVAAKKYGTRAGVRDEQGWFGFTQVAAAAARLNRIVVEALLAEDVPALTLSPSASALCRAGHLAELDTASLHQALAAQLLPVIHGDVAFDQQKGGTIVSTEEVMAYLIGTMRPNWLLLAGEVPGVLDQDGAVIPAITPANFPEIKGALGGSRGTDVTGGMASKVALMWQLCVEYPGLQVRIFSGLEPGLLQQVCLDPAVNAGTHLHL